MYTGPENRRYSFLINLCARLTGTKLELALLDARLAIKKHQADLNSTIADGDDAPSDTNEQDSVSITPAETQRQINSTHCSRDLALDSWKTAANLTILHFLNNMIVNGTLDCLIDCLAAQRTKRPRSDAITAYRFGEFD